MLNIDAHRPLPQNRYCYHELFLQLLLRIVNFWILIVITQEKTIQNVEGFDKSKLKHTETAEKVVLPDQQGTLIFFVGLSLL